MIKTYTDSEKKAKGLIKSVSDRVLEQKEVGK